MKETLKPRMVPRTVQVTFQWALTGKPIAHKIHARPDTKVYRLLHSLCAATGRAIEETRLVFRGKRLSNKTTLAKSGLQGQVAIGVVVVQPSFTCGGCGKTTDLGNA